MLNNYIDVMNKEKIFEKLFEFKLLCATIDSKHNFSINLFEWKLLRHLNKNFLEYNLLLKSKK
jgi:hypothetical protein